MNTTKHRSFCRTCQNLCAVVVEVQDNRVVGVSGDAENPLFYGYTCNKGRAHPAMYGHPDRVVQTMRRGPEGSLSPIDLNEAIQSIARQLSEIIAEHGPRAVALYAGTVTYLDHPANLTMGDAFMRAVGSPMTFSSSSIDQSGKPVAKAMHGLWMAPSYGALDPDLVLLVGNNPLISHAAWPGNPGDFFKDMARREVPLVVIDPRVTETAKRADLHLQPFPGHDAAILAAMLRIIIDESLTDQDFVAENATGLDALRESLEPFEAQTVAVRAGIDADDLVRAARLYGRSRRGFATAGTGPSMSGDSTLLEYLLLCLHTVCGHWSRAGDPVRNALTMVPSYAQLATAQALPPFPGYGYGERSRVRELGLTGNGMPTATAAEEMLLEGPGRVRALLSIGGNPVAAWPDQQRTMEAFAGLDLMVQADVMMSATAKVADYLIPSQLPYEQASTTFVADLLSGIADHYGLRESYAHYTDPIVTPADGTISNPDLLFRLAQAMGLQLEVHPGPGSALPGGTPVALDMSGDLDHEHLMQIVHQGSRVPFDEVRKQPGGAYFPAELTVASKAEGWEGRLDLANPAMMEDLAAVAARAPGDADYPFRLVSRRLPHVFNTPTLAMPTNRPRYNPIFMHPGDIEGIGASPRSEVEVRSARSAITAIVHEDLTVRPGTASLSHCWGSETGFATDELPGSSIGRLIDNTTDFDPYTGQPRMSNIPVKISAHTYRAASQ